MFVVIYAIQFVLFVYFKQIFENFAKNQLLFLNLNLTYSAESSGNTVFDD